MKHIRKFETTAGFEAERPTLALPNVSLVTQTNTINYLPYGGDTPSEPEWVEINGVKWATMNLGATDKYDVGLYYQWGDTQGYTTDKVGNGEGMKYFDDDDYKYYDGSDYYTKYNEKDGNLVLDPSDDAATVALGANWRMPTAAEVELLNTSDNVIYSPAHSAGASGATEQPVDGFIVRDNNDPSKELFLPMSNVAQDGEIKGDEVFTGAEISIPLAAYWTKTGSEEASASYSYTATMMVGYKGATEFLTQSGSTIHRSWGLPIRPVYVEA